MADVIWSRVVRAHVSAAQKVLVLDDEVLRGAGLSRNKTAYIKNIARAVSDESLMLDKKFNGITDAAVISQLTAIKGIGDWTTEMFLIFSLSLVRIYSFDLYFSNTFFCSFCAERRNAVSRNIIK